MAKLKILELIGDPSLAGAPRHLLSILNKSNHQKFSFFVVCPPGPLAGEIRGLKKHVIVETAKMSSRFDFASIRFIRKYARKIKPDLIHVHGTRAGLLGRLAVVGLNIPVVYTEHLWTKHYRLPSRIAQKIQLSGLWFLDMFTSYNIAVSQAVKEFMVDNQISRDEKIVVIYNGIEMASKSANVFSGNEYVIGTIGTLNFHKGIQYLIEAMPKVLEEFPKVKLEIVGNGGYRENLAKLIRKLKLTRSVHLAGFTKDIEDEIAKFDIYVQPSLSESFGLAIVQAMSMGVPVVATNTGGIPEVVTANKSGILVKAGDSKALSDAILKLLREPKIAKQMGKMGAEDVKIKFNLDDMIKETENLYESIAQQRPLG